MTIHRLLIFISYQAISLLALPLFPFYLLIRTLRGKTTIGSWKERLGWVPKPLNNAPTIWIHAVSVGEILSTQTLLEHIKKTYPNTHCYLTCGTSTAKAVALKQLNADSVSFVPFDFLPCILLAFWRIRPRSLLIIEAEWWPNLILIAHYMRVPLHWINARIRAQSAHRTQRYAGLIVPLLNCAQQLLVQTPQDAELFTRMGIDPAKLTVMGDLKIINVLHKRAHTIAPAATADKSIKILLVGSVYEHELPIYLTLFKQLKIAHPTLKLIVAPRHFTWKQSLCDQIQAHKFGYTIWTNIHDARAAQANSSDRSTHAARTCLHESDILVLWELGTLFALHEIADLFFLGGTFVPIGGHNVLEAATWSKPIIVGPYHANSQVIIDKLCAQNGIRKVANVQELYTCTAQLLNNPEQAVQIGTNARAWLEHNAHLVEHTLEQLLKKIGANV